MIETAEKSVVLSGNYCGGNSFDEILDVFISKLQDGKKIKILLLSSSKFFTESNKSKIDLLTSNYPELFQIILTDDCFMYSDELKKITNHTKGLVVDGMYSVMGGSGIEDKYAYYEGVGDRCGNVASNGGFLDYLLPRGFRDMDFGFVGSEFAINLQEQLLNLGRIWKIYNCDRGVSSGPDVTTLLLDELKSEYKTKTKTKTKTKNDRKCPMDKGALKNRWGGKMAVGTARIYCSGPEQSSNDFYDEVKRRVKAAKKHIYIDRMYFHCPEDLKSLLAKKVNSGVKLTIVTNGNEKFSPSGHKAFGPRNRAEVKSLLTQIRPECIDNISVYEYGQKEANLPRKTTLHKKVIVIDDFVLAGSSNLGYKSMVSCSDHEVNFVAKSKELARRTIAVIQDDAYKLLRKPEVDAAEDTAKPLSKKLDLSTFYVSTREQFASFMHRYNAWLIG